MDDLHKRLSHVFVELSARIENGQLTEAFVLFEKIVDVETNKYKNALEELIKLKDYKDKNGKDPYYINAKLKAWDNARGAL